MPITKIKQSANIYGNILHLHLNTTSVHILKDINKDNNCNVVACAFVYGTHLSVHLMYCN